MKVLLYAAIAVAIALSLVAIPCCPLLPAVMAGIIFRLLYGVSQKP